MKQKKEFIQTDLLIIGGGASGCIAAIGAKEQGDLEVLVLEKAEISRSGDAGGGNDHLLAHLNTGEAWDTDQAMAEYYTRVSQGLIDIRVANRLHISRIREIVDRLESFGIEMRDPKQVSTFAQNRSASRVLSSSIIRGRGSNRFSPGKSKSGESRSSTGST